MKKNKIYYIEWLDATLCGLGWMDSDEKFDLSPVKSVGFLHQADKNKIVIKQNFDKNHISNAIVIPRIWVQKIKKLN